MIVRHKLHGVIAVYCGCFYSTMSLTQLLDAALFKVVYNILSLSNKKTKAQNTRLDFFEHKQNFLSLGTLVGTHLYSSNWVPLALGKSMSRVKENPPKLSCTTCRWYFLSFFSWSCIYGALNFAFLFWIAWKISWKHLSLEIKLQGEVLDGRL